MILNLENSVLRKNIIALISRTISFNLLLILIRWDEHCDIGKNSEPVKHLYRFSLRRFNWKILKRVPNKVRQRKIHEAYYVMCLRPTLNNQLELTSLTLFQNGVT